MTGRSVLKSNFSVTSLVLLSGLMFVSPIRAELTASEKSAAATLPPFLKIAPYETEQLGEGLYSFRWGAYRNIFMVTNEGVIVTDPMGVESAVAFREEIAKITDQPVKYVAYSQSHGDHVTGAGIFKDEGAKIVAHEKCAANIRERPNQGLIAPDITFTDDYSIELGGRRLDLYYFGPADDDCGVVMVPSTEPILYVTDTLNPAISQGIPWNPQVPDFFPHNIIPFIESVEALGAERDLTEFIGGHVTFAPGPDGKASAYPSVGPFSQITEKRELYERIFAAVEAEWDAGTPEAEIPQVIIDKGALRGIPNYSKNNVWMFTRKIAAYYAAGAPGAGAPAHATRYEIAIEPIAEGLYAFRAGPVRSFFMIGNESVVVVDPISADVARALRAEIAALSGKPVSHVVYSHSLNQRALGGQIFKDEGARFVASKRCDENFRKIPRADVVMPDDLFSSKYVVPLGNRSLELYDLGLHYDCSIVMITRPDNYLFVVGTVSPPAAAIPADPSLLNVYAYNLVNFLGALEVFALQQNAETMIADTVMFAESRDGEHIVAGPTGSATVIGAQRMFWEQLFSDVRAAKEEGIGGSRVGRYIDHAPYEDLQNYDKKSFPWIARRVISVLWTGK